MALQGIVCLFVCVCACTKALVSVTIDNHTRLEFTCTRQNIDIFQIKQLFCNGPPPAKVDNVVTNNTDHTIVQPTSQQINDVSRQDPVTQMHDIVIDNTGVDAENVTHKWKITVAILGALLGVHIIVDVLLVLACFYLYKHGCPWKRSNSKRLNKALPPNISPDIISCSSLSDSRMNVSMETLPVQLDRTCSKRTNYHRRQSYTFPGRISSPSNHSEDAKRLRFERDVLHPECDQASSDQPRPVRAMIKRFEVQGQMTLKKERGSILQSLPEELEHGRELSAVSIAMNGIDQHENATTDVSHSVDNTHTTQGVTSNSDTTEHTNFGYSTQAAYTSRKGSQILTSNMKCPVHLECSDSSETSSVSSERSRECITAGHKSNQPGAETKHRCMKHSPFIRRCRLSSTSTASDDV